MGGVGEGVLDTARFLFALVAALSCLAANVVARSHYREALVAPRLLRARD